MSEATQEQKPQTIDPAELKAFLAEPKTRQTMIDNANALLKNVSRNWFGLDRIIRKTQYNRYETAKTIMDLLVMSGLAHSRIENGQMSWKITLNEDDKIQCLKGDISAIDAQILLLEEKKAAVLVAIRLKEPDYDPNATAEIPLSSFLSSPAEEVVQE
jgi:hypothetical protein